MELIETARYKAYGLDAGAQASLAALGDSMLGAGFNVTGLTDPQDIERIHFLDSLSLLELDAVRSATEIVDIGSGAGLPALVLALVLAAGVTAVESQQKKCRFIAETAQLLALENVQVVCARAEEYGQGRGRETHDLAVSRALASLAVVAEYSLPLLRLQGTMVAMRGRLSAEERLQAERAIAILGGESLESVRLDPFPGAQNRWVHIVRKIRVTPPTYPRRVGIPTKRPLGL